MKYRNRFGKLFLFRGDETYAFLFKAADDSESINQEESAKEPHQKCDITNSDVIIVRKGIWEDLARLKFTPEPKSIEELIDKHFRKHEVSYGSHWVDDTFDCVKDAIEDIAKEYAETAPNWIKISDHQPIPGTDVLIVIDVTRFGRGRRIEKARVNYTPSSIQFGGPNALSGSGRLVGIFFSIPAILNPDDVTHWAYLPTFPID